MSGDVMNTLIGIVAVIVALAFVAFFFWCYVRILRRAGLSGWWCLTMLIPLVGFVMIWVFAFIRWPAIDGPGPARVHGVDLPGASPDPGGAPEWQPPPSDPGARPAPVGGTIVDRGGAGIGQTAEDNEPTTAPAGWMLSGFDGEGRAVRLELGEMELTDGVLVGRDDQQCQRTLADTSISRVHARMSMAGGEFLVEDLESSNGTFVNGEEVPEGETVAVRSGSEIAFANTRLRLTRA